jgi:hypothetical protein
LVGIVALRRTRSQIAFGLLVAALLVICHACGGGGGPSSGVDNGNSASGTPTNTVYTVTVTATSGQLSHSTTFAFTIIQ